MTPRPPTRRTRATSSGRVGRARRTPSPSRPPRPLLALGRHASGSRTSTPTRSSTRPADDVMAEGDLAEALRRLMERGWRCGDPTRPDLAGLQDLMERLARRREELLERYQLGDVLGDIRQELDEIVARRAARRRTPARRRHAPARHPTPAPAPDAPRRWPRERLDQLDALPPRHRRADPRTCASTTSSSPRRATAVRRARRAAPASRCSTSTCRACATRSGRSRPRTSRRTARWSATSTRCSASGSAARPRTRREFLAQARPVLPGRPDVRRHHRAARRADGRDAVAAALDDARSSAPSSSR